MPRSWDIFCRVVDNYGDAGVCWRLARELAARGTATVRLWIDDLETLRRLDPGVSGSDQQTVDRVEVRRWPAEFSGIAPAEIVIEAFGCGIPESYAEAMGRATPSPLWIVLEYVSAEPWVPGHHGLPSPHPRYSIERYFFFPGFVQGTGGLLREADLFARRDAFDAAKRDAFWHSVGHVPPPPDALVASVFAYEGVPLAELLGGWEHGARTIVAALPDSPIVPTARHYFGVDHVPADRVLRRGALELRFLPFVPQARYDELLWSCDCNFVRGEESFVRAQWAARPFVWYVYPQDEGAHLRKLEAFLDLYCKGLPNDAAAAVGSLMRVWNRSDACGVSSASAWEALVGQRAVLHRHGREWAERVAAIGDLAENLAQFCRGKLK